MCKIDNLTLFFKIDEMVLEAERERDQQVAARLEKLPRTLRQPDVMAHQVILFILFNF